jgi:hypothetical protein
MKTKAGYMDANAHRNVFSLIRNALRMGRHECRWKLQEE